MLGYTDAAGTGKRNVPSSVVTGLVVVAISAQCRNVNVPLFCFESDALAFGSCAADTLTCLGISRA